MEFTTDEKKAINCLLVNLMKIDGKTDVSEAVTLYEINRITKLSINESTVSLKMGFEECKEILLSMESYKRRIAKNYFEHMAETDGLVKEVESDYIYKIFGEKNA